jgi:hypothetical protein
VVPRGFVAERSWNAPLIFGAWGARFAWTASALSATLLSLENYGNCAARIRHCEAGIHSDQQRRQVLADGLLLATPLLVVSRLAAEAAMGQWLIADISLLDTHLQLWMLLVTGIMLLWFFYVWATR